MEPNISTLEESIREPLARRTGWIPRIRLRGVGLRASERSLLLFAVDAGLMVLSLFAAVKVRTEWLDAPGSFTALWRWWAMLVVLWWIVAQLLEGYDLALAASAPHSMLSAGAAAAITAVLYQFIPYYTPPLSTRGLALLFVVAAVAAVMLWRGIYAVLFVQPAFETRVLVFGAGFAGRALAGAMRRMRDTGSINPYYGTGYRIVGFVDDDPDRINQAEALGAPVLGGSRDLVRLARELQPDQVVLAITHRHAMEEAAFDAVMTCREQGFHVTTMQAVYERILGRVPVDHIGRNVTMVLPADDRGPGERVYGAIKRATDFLIAGLTLIPLGAILPLVALLNLLGNRGPLFYRQVRVGQAGRLFEVYKLRTMVTDAEKETGAVWARAGDPRVTPVGRLLRRARVDELPQVLNVLRGEMSLIGPRPERPEFVDALAREIPFYRARHAVRPGLTGWAQVRYGYGSSVEDARIKLEYDLYYVRHAGFYLDALIWLKTLAVVLRLQGK